MTLVNVKIEWISFM